MKIKFARKAGDLTGLVSVDLDLCGQGRPEGSAEGLIGLKLTSSNVRVTPRVAVTSGTTTSKRGVRSAVIKVSMPYTAFMRDENNAIIVDPKRTTGEISMHIVLNLPANAAADLRSTDGAANANPAYAQVVVVSHLLRALLSKGLMERNKAVSSQDDPNADLAIEHGIQQPETIAYALPIPEADDNGDFQFDATSIRRENFSDLANFVVRVSNGLPPLGCGDVTTSLYHNTDTYRTE